jgi:hypothetical protein
LNATGRTLAVLPALFFFVIGSIDLAHADDAIDGFLARHWSRPLASQGPAPEKFSPLDAALNPADCGQCHVEQFRDWQTALHARAMGPGLMGQLITMAPDARSDHQDCLRCHAPLAEQADALVAAIGAATAPLKPKTARKPPPESAAGALPQVTGMHVQGLTCAACHVRANQRFGPPRRDGSAPDASQNATLPHGGFTTSAAFEDSRFCAACHQFQPDEFALNGKLLENTLNEWQSSRHAREGRSCQSCHMPDRRHLWRGIHDPEMVRSGVSFSPEPPETPGKSIRAALLIRNSGTGHAFPTYVTPRVIVEIEQLGADGRPLRGTRVERIIQRKVPLDLSREIFDTRLPPDGELRLDYRKPRARGAATLVYRMRIEPDEYYARFYRSILAGGEAGRGAPLIREALGQAESSGFVAYEQRYPL